MAADRRGNDAADADAIYDAVRRSQRVDPDSAANREPADKNCLKRPVLLAISARLLLSYFHGAPPRRPAQRPGAS